MKWHRIKTEADLPPIGQKVLLHFTCYGNDSVTIGSYYGKIYDKKYGCDAYRWYDMDLIEDEQYHRVHAVDYYAHWAEIEMPPHVVLD